MLKFIWYFFLIALTPIWVFILSLIMIKVVMLWHLLFLTLYIFYREQKRGKPYRAKTAGYFWDRVVRKYSAEKEGE